MAKSHYCTSFIRLTTVVLNTAGIRKIEIIPNKYIVHTSPMGEFSGMVVVGTGYISSDTDGRYVICRKRDPQDFHMMETWIDRLNK